MWNEKNIAVIRRWPVIPRNIGGPGGCRFPGYFLEEALKQAKAENKLVFVDCYTPWCGPCYKMMKEVFPKKEAGDYFNSRFVCVKYDMTKDENIGLAKRFRVGAYPTMGQSCINGLEAAIWIFSSLVWKRD